MTRIRQDASRKFTEYKSGAKRRRIPFDLTYLEFLQLWQDPCYYCGDPIPDIGIDRVDNWRGYEVGNIVPCCTICNKMKGTTSLPMWIVQLKKILKHQGEI